MSDSISRQAAVDAMGKIFPKSQLTYVESVKALEAIPPAGAVQEWIPVSERLPDSDRPVLVTIQWTDFDREVTVGEYWDNPAKAAPESEKGWGTYGDHVRLEAEVKAKRSEINELNRKIGKLEIQRRLAEIEGRKE